MIGSIRADENRLHRSLPSILPFEPAGSDGRRHPCSHRFALRAFYGGDVGCQMCTQPPDGNADAVRRLVIAFEPGEPVVLVAPLPRRFPAARFAVPSDPVEDAAACQNDLDEARRRLWRRGVCVRALVRVGSAAQVVAELARELGARMIVVPHRQTLGALADRWRVSRLAPVGVRVVVA